MNMNKALDRILERYFGGSISIGPVTVYGYNAMHFALNVRTRWGALCVHPTTRTFGGHWPWYIYVSKNCTPWAAVWGIGPGIDPTDMDKIAVRFWRWLHGRRFNVEAGSTLDEVGLDAAVVRRRILDEEL